MSRYEAPDEKYIYKQLNPHEIVAIAPEAGLVFRFNEWEWQEFGGYFHLVFEDMTDEEFNACYLDVDAGGVFDGSGNMILSLDEDFSEAILNDEMGDSDNWELGNLESIEEEIKKGGYRGWTMESNAEDEDVDDGCCFCGVDYGRYGNNAQPLFDGRCCNTCNTDLVIPARISMMFGSEEDEEVVCFICNLTPEETDGENGPMMSTLGGDACKTCAEDYGYEHPRDMIYMDAEEIEMQSLFDMMKKQATKFTGMTILFTGVAAVGGYLIGRNRG